LDNLVELYTRMEGRIARKTFWLGVLGLIIASIIVGFVILPIIGLGLMPDLSGLDPSDMEAFNAAVAGTMQRSAIGSLVLLAIFAWPTIALSLKRRHDRNSRGYDVYAFYALQFILVLLQVTGLGMSTMVVEGVAIPMPSGLYTAVSAIMGILAIYLLVVLGFLKGTTGPNDFGPDPLAGVAMAAPRRVRKSGRDSDSTYSDDREYESSDASDGGGD
jgi:uncharacterized membrane protein YhaH (DUF805 family)